MIGRLRGIILEKQPPFLLIEANGIGYDVIMPMTCFYKLPKLNHEVIIFTQFIVREDAQLLYGFIKKQERTLFRELIKVNGVGPKLALVILSGMSAKQFISAIEYEEVKTLVKLPGIGKKTAKRLVVEMKDRFKGKAHSDVFESEKICTITKEHGVSERNNAEGEAIAALVTLGYKLQEANRMVRKVGRPDIDCETLIRDALRATLLR